MLNPEAPPEISVGRWFNTKEGAEPTLANSKGKVVVVGAFQMHCAGSMGHLIPQLARMHAQFQGDEVAVLGLQSVFEKADQQTPDKLAEFLDENHLTFPVAVDRQGGSVLPDTMDAYELQGTPTVLIFDRQGRLRRHYLGQVDDMRLAAEVMALTIEGKDAPREEAIEMERRLAAVLVDPNDHQHEHGDACGCGSHDHAGHDHHHHHDHEH
ncbi:MAG: TlpA family protein disulfide reductase [Hyphomicrobiaceae bacterium]|nr:TlpA family protein disulfide reductase [Hyphomicrobiaceae bacterium]MCC0011172.1 TlpA family protein disulfide reductase [Hyphomicrobiaceae bacterium]